MERVLAPDIQCAEDGCEHAGRQQSGFAKTCLAGIPCADSEFTQVVRPDSQQYTQMHGKVLVEAIAAAIEPLELRRKVEK